MVLGNAEIFDLFEIIKNPVFLEFLVVKKQELMEGDLKIRVFYFYDNCLWCVVQDARLDMKVIDCGDCLDGDGHYHSGGGQNFVLRIFLGQDKSQFDGKVSQTLVIGHDPAI